MSLQVTHIQPQVQSLTVSTEDLYMALVASLLKYEVVGEPTFLLSTLNGQEFIKFHRNVD